eukprot:TRINITY_DN2527_c0_g1_i1.p2 TRINITY_DN2527_c0_g1~~TRINITY_DN2527_c0_g1_i1.p2  ORF type:complete len:124 (-),score=28.41 TRINITY_DN2527_c0_g1_i1:122-493(-)
MGRDLKTDEIILLDELHTPDSSRYWFLDSYQERFENDLPPENIDKDILRRWYNSNCDPYNDPVLPSPPQDLVITLSNRYIQLYELITGSQFWFPECKENIHERIERNLRSSCPFLFSDLSCGL